MNDNEEIKEKYMENIKDLEIGVNINKVLSKIFAESLLVAYSSSTFIISNLLLILNI